MMTSEPPQLDRWDVAVGLFPFTDIDHSKPRPLLVLSNASFNRAHDHVIAAMITTGAGGLWPSDYAIQDIGAAGLKRSSVVRWKLFTLPLRVVPRKVGALAETDRGLLAARLAGLMLG
jgi:mRNA interferase MazF